MNSQPSLYGLDLISDSDGETIDPLRDRIVAVGISTPMGEEIYDGDETEILRMIDARVAMLPIGVISCWLGSRVAFPFMACRAETLAVPMGLTMSEDRRIDLPGTVSGLRHPWLVSWHGHSHLDLQKVYDHEGRRRLGRRVRPDPDNLTPATNPLADRDPGRNAKLARSLATRRWGQAKRLVDQVPSRGGTEPVLATLAPAES